MSYNISKKIMLASVLALTAGSAIAADKIELMPNGDPLEQLVYRAGMYGQDQCYLYNTNGFTGEKTYRIKVPFGGMDMYDYYYEDMREEVTVANTDDRDLYDFLEFVCENGRPAVEAQ